jgi:hypothetical protein
VLIVDSTFMFSQMNTIVISDVTIDELVLSSVNSLEDILSSQGIIEMQDVLDVCVLCKEYLEEHRFLIENLDEVEHYSPNQWLVFSIIESINTIELLFKELHTNFNQVLFEFQGLKMTFLCLFGNLEKLQRGELYTVSGLLA